MSIRRSATRFSLAGVLWGLFLTLGCGDNQTVASKSAASYGEAQRKGTPVAEGHGHAHSPGEHGGPPAGPAHAGHAAPTVDPGETEADHGHSSSAEKDHAIHSQAAEVQHGHNAHTAAASASGHAHAPTQHPVAAHEHPTDMDHAKMGHSPTTPMDHSGMAQHGAGMALPPPKPEAASAVAASGAPAATLRADSIDAPAPTAVADAERSAAMAAEMATGGHGMQHGTYTQTDAGREPRPETPAADPHRMHGAPAAPRPKALPSPTPTPSPRTEEHR